MSKRVPGSDFDRLQIHWERFLHPTLRKERTTQIDQGCIGIRFVLECLKKIPFGILIFLGLVGDGSQVVPGRRKLRREFYCFFQMRYSAGNIALSRSEEHTSELQSQSNLVCRLLLEKK